MTETEIMDAAYADALKALFRVMQASYIDAGGDQQAEKHADEAFKAGAANTRKLRERALVLLT